MMPSTRNTGLSTGDLAAAGRAKPPMPEQEHVSREHANMRMNETERAPLFAQDVREGFKSRWTAVQGSFIDDPRQAVSDADELVAQVMKTLAESFANQRATLEAQFDGKNGEVDTEDLRLTLRSYRSFFERLLSL